MYLSFIFCNCWLGISAFSLRLLQLTGVPPKLELTVGVYSVGAELAEMSREPAGKAYIWCCGLSFHPKCRQSMTSTPRLSTQKLEAGPGTRDVRRPLLLADCSDTSSTSLIAHRNLNQIATLLKPVEPRLKNRTQKSIFIPLLNIILF